MEPAGLKLDARRVCPLTTRDLAAKIIQFCEFVNTVDLYAYQKTFGIRIIESLLTNDGNTITALLARQSGKSEILGCLGLGLCLLLPKLANEFPDDERLSLFRQGIRIGIFAPKLELSGPIYLKIRDRCMSDRCYEVRSDPDFDIQVGHSRGDSLQLTNGSYVRANTASEQTTNEGATYHLIFIDESQRISQSKVSKEISPMLASTNGTMVKIGTAFMSRGGFHNDIQANELHEKKTGIKNHFEFDYEKVIIERRALYNRTKREYEEGKRATPPDVSHLMWEKYVMEEKRKVGEDSEEFKMNFRLLWQESRTIAIAERLLKQGALVSQTAGESLFHGVMVAGLDVAKDNDSTVLTVGLIDKNMPLVDPVSNTVTYKKRILGWRELQGSFEHIQYNGVLEFLRRFRISKLVVDATGMGDPVHERLQVLLAPQGVDVVAFKYSTPEKSNLWKRYLMEWNAGRIEYPASEETCEMREFENFYGQHKSLCRYYNGIYLVCEAPDGEHDDYPNSGALMAHAAELALADIQQVVPEVEVDSLASQSTQMFAMSGNVQADARANRYLRRRRR